MATIPFAAQKLIKPDANDPRIRARIGILHVDAGNASSLYNLFLGNQRSGGSKVESHGFIRKDGAMEQYRDTAYQADANADGNDFALSFETQGYGEGLWTPEQIARIKQTMLWARDVHGIPLRVVTSWDDPVGGWGFHRMFDQWNPNHHSCPGPDRVKQFYDVLVPWMKTQSSKSDPKGATTVVSNHVTAAHDHLTRSINQANMAVAELKQVSRKRTLVVAQLLKLKVGVAALVSVQKNLPKS